LFKETKRVELGRAGLEVLAIVAYSGPVSREDIERIRGVNSLYTIRALVVRGLIDEQHANDVVRYTLSLEALKEFGIQSPEELPSWREIQNEITEVNEVFKRQYAP
jgi:segregation and condensation protein B